MTKKEREDFIRDKIGKNMTYQEIGDALGITRQRVHQIFRGYKSIRKPRPPYRVVNGVIIELSEEEIKERELKTGARLSQLKDAGLNVGNISKLTGMASGSRDRIRELVRIRDKHTCQKCLKKWEKGKRRFDVHHLDPEFENKTFKLSVNEVDRNNLNRMITLCHKCHLNLPHIRYKHKKKVRD